MVNIAQLLNLPALEGELGRLRGRPACVGRHHGSVLSRPRVDALTAFGESLDMVFQIRDDVLDLVGTQEVLGKPPGQDLVEGIYNLPVIHALADPDAGPELRGLLGRPVDSPERDKPATSCGPPTASEPR